MAYVLIDDEYLSDIADAIRERNGSNQTYHPSEMADAISNISGGGTLSLTSPSAQDNKNYLYFQAEEAGASVSLYVYGNILSMNLEYSTDGSTWTTWGYSGTYNNLKVKTPISLQNRGDYVFIRGNNDYMSSSNEDYSTFVLKKKVACGGNIMSLLDSSCESITLTCSYAFCKLFERCSTLTTAPELPATTITSYCYENMFDNCSSLTTAPNLPATTIASYCYESMFIGCSSLTTAPNLPATTIQSGSYQNMFGMCYNLVTPPIISATSVQDYGCASMFSNCISLQQPPSLSSITTLNNYCYESMFSECTSLTTAPELPATTLANGCYHSMFSDCISLTTAPNLPATTLTSACYQYMFSGCLMLSSVRVYAESWNTSYTTSWLNSVNSTGTLYKVSGVSVTNYPENWTIVEF